jgi:hypothetical protein
VAGLRQLTLKGTGVTDAGVEELKQALPDLSIEVARKAN